jgi:type I restriction enzyme, S subunit
MTLPTGWREATLAEVATLGSGGTPEAKNPAYYDGDIPWAVIGDLNDSVVRSTARSITRCGLDNSSAKVVPVDTILVGMYGSIGKLGIAGVRLATNQAIATIRAGDQVDHRYLFYYLLAQRRDLDHQGKGATQRNISQTVLKPWPIKFPEDLDEQRRIVELLEDHLSRLDAGRAGLAAAARRAQRLRWIAAMAEVSKAGGTEVRLGDIADVRNGIFVSRAGTEPDGVPILRIGAVRSMSLDLSDLRYSRRDESDLRAADALALPGDLLFTRYNGNPQFVGACAVVPSDAPTLTYPDKLIRVRITDSGVLPSFVALACSVGVARARIQAAVRTTAGQAGISGRDLKAVTLLLPDCDAQHSAVAAANDADVAVERLSDAISGSQRRVVALRRSLLTAAFSGQLTAETATA